MDRKTNVLCHGGCVGFNDDGEVSCRGNSGNEVDSSVPVLDAGRGDGCGIPDSLDPEQAQTLGLRLVDALTRQIQGRISRDACSGTSWHLVLPSP